MKVGEKTRDTSAGRKKALRGQRADELLNNSLFKEAFDKIENKINEGWKALDSTPETRERAYLMHRLLVQLHREFEVMIRDGKSAAKLLEQEQERGRRGTGSKPER